MSHTLTRRWIGSHSCWNRAEFEFTGSQTANTIALTLTRQTSSTSRTIVGAGPLPLKVDSWNRLKLTLVGKVARLFLNGQDVYERELEATNQLTFGLFHFADQTEARVRNIVWRGDWPRRLPPIAQQELAGEGADFLDNDIARLSAVFEHDFASRGLPAVRFKLFEEGWQPFVTQQPDGVHVTRSGVKGRFLNYTIAPRCTVQGDFDVTVSFEKFKPEPATDTAETKCCLMLSAALNDQSQTRAYLNRRHVQRANRDDMARRPA